MAETVTKLPVKHEKTSERASAVKAWRPFDALRREVEQLFDDFGGNFWRLPTRRSISGFEPSLRREAVWEAAPAVDIAESEKAYEITAELPGLEKKDVELNVTDNLLTIRGEKRSEREEKNKDYHLVERSFGSFARSVELPEG